MEQSEEKTERTLVTAYDAIEEQKASGNRPAEAKPHAPNNNQTNKKPRFWSSLNYTTRLSLMFGFIAAMTALCIIIVVSIVWGSYFTSYTHENMQTAASSIANKVSAQYSQRHDWSNDTVAAAEYAEIAYPGVGVMIVNREGQEVFDSSKIENSSASPLSDGDKIATAPIVVDEQVVGSVRLWVSGSDSLLRESDLLFRNSSYQALIFAGIFAIVLSCVIGFMFARNLVRPINRMTKTVTEIKDGNLSARTKVTGDDEVSHLAQTFDEMAESIENDRNLERRLTTDVAHELRTPLMAIQSTVEAMVDGVFPADEAHLMTVNSEVQRLSRLVDSMLKLSRLENRAKPLKDEIVNVGDLVETIVETHTSYVEESGLSLSSEVEPNVHVKGDPDMIRQATANLISNAVRYTPEGGHIWVRVHKGEIMASISVEDTGVGLTPEEAKMVFSRFWRADSGRKRESGGLGIGLSVVKEIVERHGGWVQVEGHKDEGSRFTIHLPLYDEVREAKARRSRRQNQWQGQRKKS